MAAANNAADNNDDTGLGLKEFLSGGKTAEPQVETVAETGAEKSAPAEQVAEKTEAKGPAGSDKDGKGGDVKAEAKAEAPNWEADDNPYKKRYTDTHAWANKQNQERIEFQRKVEALNKQLETLHQKFDGTYDPEANRPPQVDPDQVRQYGTLEGKAEASLAAAIEQHGQEAVMKDLERFRQVFGEDREVQQKVLMSPHPIREAMKAVKSHDFFQKYGYEPDSIMAKFKAEFEETELPKLREAELKRLQAEAKKQTPPEPRGIGSVQGTSGVTDSQVKKDNASRPISIHELGGHRV